MTSGIVNALSKFTGIPPGPIQKLVSFLMPMILGAIATRFAGKAVTGPAVKGLLSDQKSNIAHALPSGFSLNEVPGLATTGSALRGAADTAGSAARGAADAVGSAARGTAGAVGTAARGTMDTARSTARAAADTTQDAGKAMKWVLPAVLALGLLCLVGWLAYKGLSALPKTTPGLPDVAKLNTDLTGTFRSLNDSLGDIKDAASAEKALPKLAELNTKLDGMKAEVERLPEAEKAKITDLIKPSLSKLQQQYAKLVWMPGVGDKVGPTLDQVTGKLAAMGGLPPPQLGKVSSELAGTVTSLTESLSGIKDAASAEKAMPSIQELGNKLDSAKAKMDTLSPDDKAIIRTPLKTALASLKELVDRVLLIAGVGDKIKPMVDSLMDKLTTLAV
jgi:hypothetical protein